MSANHQGSVTSMKARHHERSARINTTSLMAEIAFGDELYPSLYASTDDLHASIEREARRARWQRKKGGR